MTAPLPPWKIVTKEQLKEGWMEFRGVSPVHHEYVVLGERPDGTYVVRNPELWLLEHPVFPELSERGH